MGVEATAAQAQAHPRAFAIFKSELASKDASAEELKKLIKEFGAKDASGSATDFDSFARAVQRATSHPGAEGSGNCLGLASKDEGGHLVPLRFERRALNDDDVRFSITHCGVCHSDLHQIKGEWGGSVFPMVPGHELVGIVTEVGPGVTKFKPGDRAAVGCMVDSCGDCRACARGLQQYCPDVIYTYNGVGRDGTATQGGYSTHMVCREAFVLRFPDSLPLAAGAPLLCAGITTYSPLRHFGLDKPGTKLGVVGLGGLGHMAVKFGKAFGAEVTILSTSPGKREEALSGLGADHFVVSKDAEAMKAIAGTLDGIINTVSAKHPLEPYLGLLGIDGVMVMVGIPPEPLALRTPLLLSNRRSLAGSGIGSIQETQEMLDFCGQKGITCQIEEVGAGDINAAMERLAKNDVKYRFVINIAKTLVA